MKVLTHVPSMGFSDMEDILHPWNMGEIHALVNGRGCWGVDVLVFCAGWVGHKGGYWVGGTRDLLRVCASH